MALPSTLHHLDLRFSQADLGIDGELSLKVARHPSETMERLWLRILAFAWKWREGLAFGPGLCEPDAPDLAAVHPDGRTAVLVRVGKPEPQRIERDVNRNSGAEWRSCSIRRGGSRRSSRRRARAAPSARPRPTSPRSIPPLLRELGAREERRIGRRHARRRPPLRRGGGPVARRSAHRPGA